MSEQKFKPFDRVLVRVSGEWWADFFSHFNGDTYITSGGGGFDDDSIIPYEGNEHLLGTTDDPKPKWQPKIGEAVLVRNNDRESWQIRLFVNMYNGKYSATLFEELNSRTLWEQCKPYKPNSEEE